MRILKSMPIVVMKEGVKLSSLKRRRQHDLPTPESPIRRSFICRWRCELVGSNWELHIVAVLAAGGEGGVDSRGSRNFVCPP